MMPSLPVSASTLPATLDQIEQDFRNRILSKEEEKWVKRGLAMRSLTVAFHPDHPEFENEARNQEERYAHRMIAFQNSDSWRKFFEYMLKSSKQRDSWKSYLEAIDESIGPSPGHLDEGKQEVSWSLAMVEAEKLCVASGALSVQVGMDVSAAETLRRCQSMRVAFEDLAKRIGCPTQALLNEKVNIRLAGQLEDDSFIFYDVKNNRLALTTGDLSRMGYEWTNAMLMGVLPSMPHTSQRTALTTAVAEWVGAIDTMPQDPGTAAAFREWLTDNSASYARRICEMVIEKEGNRLAQTLYGSHESLPEDWTKKVDSLLTRGAPNLPDAVRSVFKGWLSSPPTQSIPDDVFHAYSAWRKNAGKANTRANRRLTAGDPVFSVVSEAYDAINNGMDAPAMWNTPEEKMATAVQGFFESKVENKSLFHPMGTEAQVMDAHIAKVFRLYSQCFQPALDTKPEQAHTSSSRQRRRPR